MRLNKTISFSLTGIAILSCRVSASFQWESEYPSHPFPFPIWRQYQSFFDHNSGIFQRISSIACNDTLSEYNEVYDAPRDSLRAQTLLLKCYAHEACILDNLPKDFEANGQSAAVILGLMPTLLSTLGPTIAEIGHLSRHRPVLATLLSLGAPAILPERILDFTAHVTLKRHQVLNDFDFFFQRPLTPSMAVAIALTQYVLALMAAINILWLCVEIGKNTVLTWACATQILPLLWVILPLGIHLLSAAGFAMLGRMARKKNHAAASLVIMSSRAALGDVAYPVEQETSIIEDVLNNFKIPRFSSKIYQFVRTEVTPCNTQVCDCLQAGTDLQHSWLATLSIVIAGALAWIHVALGIFIFSSLTPLTVWDALNSIFWRFIVSTVICRTIVIVESLGVQTHAGIRKTSEEAKLEI